MLVTIAVTGFIAFRRWTSMHARSAAVAPKVPALAEVTLSGVAQPRTIVNIPAPADGLVTRFMANAGDDVFEGELLAQIKNPKLESAAQAAQETAARSQAHVADLENALIAARLEASRARSDETRVKAELGPAEKNYQTQKELNDQGATPRLTFEKAEKDYQSLKADSETFAKAATVAEDRVASLTSELEEARKTAQAKSQAADEANADLGAGEVHSTVDGVVLGRKGQAGEPVSRDTQDLFQIGTGFDKLQVAVTPDPKSLARIRVGQGVTIVAADLAAPIQGSVREIQAGSVMIDFTNPTGGVKPGQPVRVKIRLN